MANFSCALFCPLSYSIARLQLLFDARRGRGRHQCSRRRLPTSTTRRRTGKSLTFEPFACEVNNAVYCLSLSLSASHCLSRLLFSHPRCPLIVCNDTVSKPFSAYTIYTCSNIFLNALSGEKFFSSSRSRSSSFVPVAMPQCKYFQ